MSIGQASLAPFPHPSLSNASVGQFGASPHIACHLPPTAPSLHQTKATGSLHLTDPSSTNLFCINLFYIIQLQVLSYSIRVWGMGLRHMTEELLRDLVALGFFISRPEDRGSFNILGPQCHHNLHNSRGSLEVAQKELTFCKSS